MSLTPITRRDLLFFTAATTAGLAIPTIAWSEEKKKAPNQLPPFRLNDEEPPHPMFVGYLGNNRFRTDSEIIRLQFSPDGKYLLAMTFHELYIWEYQTGNRIARMKTPHEQYAFETVLLQNNCVNALIINLYQSNQSNRDFCHHVRFDIKTNLPVSQIAIPCEKNSTFAYHPEGKYLFANYEKSECLYELTYGGIIGKSRIDKFPLEIIEPSFSPDGKSVLMPTFFDSKKLLHIFDDPAMRMKIYATNRLAIQSECWLPDGRILAIHRSWECLVSLDSEGNATEVSATFELKKFQLAGITSDHRFAIMLMGDEIQFEPIVKKWFPRIDYKLKTKYARSVANRPQGRISSYSIRNCVEFINPIRSEILSLSADFPSEIREIYWSSRYVLKAIAYDFGTMVCRIDHPNQSTVVNRDVWWRKYENVKFSDDGSAVVANDNSWIQSFDAMTGQQKNKVRMPDEDLLFHRVTSDSRYILGEKSNNQIWKVDLRNGEYQKLSLRSDVGKFEKSVIQIEKTMGAKCAVLCKHGEIAELFIIDLESMEVLLKYRCKLARNELPVAFCRDGQFIVTCHGDMEVLSEMDSHPTKIAVMSSLNGQVLRQVYVREKVMHEVFFVSPDSRIIIVPQRDQLSIREMATLDERFNIPITSFHCISVSPDSRYLARDSFYNQYPIELFNLRGEFNPADPIPENYSLSQAWIDLQSRSAKIGFRAIRYLAKNPVQSIRLFKSKIQHPKMVADKQIQQWIEDLDDDDFKTRETAQRALVQEGPRIRSQLNAWLKKTDSAETRQRLQSIMQSFLQASTSQIIIERACEVLQWIESSESKALLREWSRGAPQSPLTEEAIETLKVLKRLESDPPTVHTHSPAMPAPSR